MGIDQSSIKKHPSRQSRCESKIVIRHANGCTCKGCKIEPWKCVAATFEFPSNNATARFIDHTVAPTAKLLKDGRFSSTRTAG